LRKFDGSSYRVKRELRDFEARGAQENAYCGRISRRMRSRHTSTNPSNLTKPSNFITSRNLPYALGSAWRSDAFIRITLPGLRAKYWCTAKNRRGQNKNSMIAQPQLRGVNMAKTPETDATETASEARKEARDIPGNLPYTTSHGVLKTVLDGIITAERPDRFSGDYLGTVLKVTGGSARSIPPILKRMGFLSSDGTPTEIYSKFKSDSGRSNAALEGLRKAFAELFRRNEFIHKADADKVRDLIVEVTGLNKNDIVVRAIAGTFQAIRGFIDNNKLSDEESERPVRQESSQSPDEVRNFEGGKREIALKYEINVVLPETTNSQVFNAIFKSLKDNLLS
jgi:hypothetical protein